MTPSEKKAEIAAFIKAREAATPGEWEFNVSTLREAALWIPSWDGRLYLRADKGTDVSDWRMAENTRFIALAANTSVHHARDLLRALEVIERLSEVGPPSRSCHGSEVVGVMLNDNCKIASEFLDSITNTKRGE